MPHPWSLQLNNSTEESPSEANSLSHEEFYWTWRFTAVFKRACHLQICSARSNKSTLPNQCRLDKIYTNFHPRLGLPSRLTPSGFLTQTLQALRLSTICATYPTHLILLDLITRIIHGALKTPGGFWNLKSSVLAKYRFHTEHHHVQWCLEISWCGAMVSATPHCGTGIVDQNISLLQLHSVVSDSRLKGVMLLATIRCYCGYRNASIRISEGQ